MLNRLRYVFATTGLVFLAACGGDSSTTTNSKYTVGGTVFGLTSGKSFQLDLRTGGGSNSVLTDTKKVTVGGEFTFGPQLDSGVTYTVSVSEQPYGQACSVRNSTSTISNNVTNVFVDCKAQGNFVFAVNEMAATVASYSIDYSTGGLTSAGTPVSTLTRGITSSFPAPQNIALHPTGKYAYVTNEGANSIVKYSVNSSSGTLSSAISTTGITSPKGIVINAAGTYAYVGKPSGLSWYSIDATTGDLTYSGSNDFVDFSGVAVDKLIIDPSGGFLYGINHENGYLIPLAVNSSNGAVTRTDSVATNNSCPDTKQMSMNGAVVDSLGYVYVAAGDYANPGGVVTFSLNTAPGSGYGKFSETKCLLATNGIAQSIAIDPTGKYVYVTSNNTIIAYKTDIAGGLTAIGSPLATGSSPTSITVERGGKYVYVANGGDNTISSYSINATSGALTFVGTTSTGSGSQPQAITSY